ncbi:hypothetical protein CPB83DRAFT_861976 [Crepidotus variabilis]|uniref:Transglutaminase-like domain-containing protein n=1 Tax=Crepidotus variabilis TaxID=179855 RepID=A0A9P6JKA7_9AGAR|nr:hypothetical protein CPB83DRAFT_861976 [Crepidotus variabilis]
MAAVRPPVPRRPVPLPRDNTEADDEPPSAAPKDLAARIAALSIAVSSADAKAKSFSLAKAPISPRFPARSQSSAGDEDLDVGRLLARKPPPPPPMKRASTIPISQGYGAPPPPPKRASRIVSNPQSEVEPAVRPPLPRLRRASSLNPPRTEESEQESYTEPTSPPPPKRRVPPPPTEVPEEREELEEPPPIPSRRRLPPPLSKQPEVEEYQEPPPPVPYRRRIPPLPAVEPEEVEFEEPSPPPPPRRRLPPPIDRSKPPPPIINTSSKPQLHAQGHQLPDHGSCLKCRDFTEVDTHATYFPRQEVTTLPDLAYSLTSPFEADVDKARVLFTWLHLNIAYNVADFFSGNIKHATPESTLRSGLAVCGGYAGLFKHLAELSGLQAHEVSGHGKGFGYAPLAPGKRPPPESSGHAWNCVYFEGEWHLIDPCWGAGAVSDTYTQRFDPSWFHSSVEEFGLRHFPTDRSYQLTEVAKTWEEYITSPPSLLVPSTVLENGYDAYSILPNIATIPGSQYVQFKIAKLCVHMSVAPQDNYSLLLYSGEDRVPLEFDYNEYAWTATYLTPTSGQVTLMFIDTLNGQDARGTNATQYIGRAAMSFKSLASWSIEV